MALEHSHSYLPVSGRATGRTASKADRGKQYEWRDETIVTDQGPGSLLLPLQRPLPSQSKLQLDLPYGARMGSGSAVGTGGHGTALQLLLGVD